VEHDGVSFADIGAAAGTYYEQSVLDGGVLDVRYYTKTQLDGGSLDTLYYTQTVADSTFAPIAHTHVYADVTDFAAGVAIEGAASFAALAHAHVAADITDFAAEVGVEGAAFFTLIGHTHSYLDIPDFATGVAATAGAVFAPVVHTHVAADVTDFVAEAQAANAGLFATVAHTHVAADITDFDAASDARIALAEVGDLADISTTAYSDGELLVYNSTGSVFTNRLLVTDDLDDVDTTTAALVLNQALLWDGVNQFINRAILKSDVSDFVETDFVHVTGDETIAGEKTFTGDVIMQGTVVDIEATDLRVTDNYIDINFGEAGAGVTAGDGGIRIDRGTLDDALIEWDETTDQWLIGVVGNTLPILTGAHSHVVAHITDFAPGVTAELNVNDLDEMQDVTYPVAPVLNDFLLRDGAGQWNATSLSAAVTTELGLNQVEDIGDVNAYAALAAQDALLWDGAGWQNRPVVKADVSDFVEADYVHVTGNEVIAGIKTFSDNAIFNGDLTVNGTTTTIDTVDLVVQDNLIVINDGEAGPGVGGGAGSAGIQVDRGAAPPPVGGFATDALLIWDETNLQWQAGVIGNTTALSLAGHLHVLTDITDVSASAAEVNFLTGVTSLVQTQLDDKISRAGDAMDAGVNLSFSGLGEVLGLPATPSATAATSKEYVDAQIAANNELEELADVDVDGQSDLGPAVPSYANRDVLIYDLANTRWQNRPFVEADISDLGLTILENSDIGVNVQAYDSDLDDLAGLAHTGDEMIYSNAGTWATTASTAFGRGLINEATALSTRTTLDLYSATQLDGGQLDTRYYTETELDGTAGSAGAKIDKVSGATAGDVATMTAAGEVASSGTLLADVALTADHYTKTESDATGPAAGAKVDKVTGVSGNVVEFGASNAIADTGTAMADVLTIASSINDLSDVSAAAPVASDILVWNGAVWLQTSPPLSPFVAKTGDTISGDLIVTGDLTVSGTTTSIDTVNLDVEDNVIRINNGYTGAYFTGGMGFEANRGTVPSASVANLLWDENGSIGSSGISQRWVGGVVGSEDSFAQSADLIAAAQPDYTLEVGTGAASYDLNALAGITLIAAGAGKANLQVFVNGIKQIEGAAKAYQVAGNVVTFTAGNIPAASDDVEFYAFGSTG
jgi:hypothetical protein